MSKKTYLILSVVNVLLILAQSVTYWLWTNGLITRSKPFFNGFVGHVPALTDFVFMTWEYWWLVPFLCLLFFILVLVKRDSNFLTLASFLTAMISLLVMWYALYPIHAMQPGL